MALIVAKFGGTSLANPERIFMAAGKIATEVKRGHQVAVVVSAMAGETNRLVSLCHMIDPNEDKGREYAAIVTAGEQVSIGLMALALKKLGVSAQSLAAWQLPIRTDNQHGNALIEHIDTAPITELFKAHITPVIAGFQGLAPDNSLTTLGRNGSDTTAVAVAAFLRADRCDIYTDVDGVYSEDPHKNPNAQKIETISYAEMLSMAENGAKVLHERAAEIALKHKVRVQILSTFGDAVGSDEKGTIIGAIRATRLPPPRPSGCEIH